MGELLKALKSSSKGYACGSLMAGIKAWRAACEITLPQSQGKLDCIEVFVSPFVDLGSFFFHPLTVLAKGALNPIKGLCTKPRYFNVPPHLS